MVRLLTDGKYLIIDFNFNKETIILIKEKLTGAVYDPSRKKWITALTLNNFYKIRKIFPDSYIDVSLRNYEWNDKFEGVIEYTPSLLIRA